MPPAQRASVLIVDDEAAIRESLRMILEFEGYRIEEATTALGGFPTWAAGDAHLAYARACLSAAAGRTEEAASSLLTAIGVRPGLGVTARWDPLLREVSSATGSRQASVVSAVLQPG